MKLEIPEQWGLCMQGNETMFVDCLHEVSATRQAGDREPFHYVEIGFAGGQTLHAVGQVLSQLGKPFRLTGYDLADGWSLDLATAESLLKPTGWNYKLNTVSGRVNLLAQPKKLNIDLAFIDGCHGAPCVVADFIAVSAHLRPGGMVIFHDASANCQGYHMQPHCGTGIDVRAALNQLGLLENWLPGWKLVGETQADHGIAVVRFVGEVSI